MVCGVCVGGGGERWYVRVVERVCEREMEREFLSERKCEREDIEDASCASRVAGTGLRAGHTVKQRPRVHSFLTSGEDIRGQHPCPPERCDNHLHKAASERRGNLKGLNTFYLEVEAKIWP